MEVGQIIKNIVPNEAVTITKVMPLGDQFSVSYTGVHSNKSSNRILSQKEVDSLEVVTTDGTFNFQGDPQRFTLFAEAERIHSAYQFDPLFAVNCSIVDPLPHQVEAVYKYMLPMPKIRFLLADDTGAGKTIMTGLLLKELIMRGLIERVLIIVPGGLTKQWQEDEMQLKFNLPFKLVNRAAFTSDPTIFSHSDHLITSIDFLRGEDVLNVVKETSWDMVIVDEAHKLSAFDYGRKKYVSKRYQALETLATKCEHLLLLTATPHRGRRDTFKNLLQLLDQDIFASDSLVTSRIQEVGQSGVNKFFIRRLKEEMRDWEGNPLFKQRFTKTTLYELTPEEKQLYDRVTHYLTRKREEAEQQANTHVTLALMVMQRRLTSSIFAIKNTLNNRYRALKGLLDELADNPRLWAQKQRFDLDMDTLDDFDEFDDNERESLENILSDPRKFKLFTTAQNIGEIKAEAEQVRSLFELAQDLYNSPQEERKLLKLRELLRSEGMVGEEKLVIFTEHRDTLIYLETKLRADGYKVAVIHGSKSVEERRLAQSEFAQDAQILIATDAAGEGINLQFCRLLINWDIPWNPNRLEQRMGRIHRYGQKQDVLVFNLVAKNTREGNVLQRLLSKLDVIRDQMGDDRVYDVISDVFVGVDLDAIIDATLNGKTTEYNQAIEQQLTPENVAQKISEQQEQLGYSQINYQEAQRLKEHSDERRLQPIYIQQFFEKAFTALKGTFSQVSEFIYQINHLPPSIAHVLKEDYRMLSDTKDVLFCFDKQVFLDYQNVGNQLKGKLHYINPGNPMFDSLIKVVRQQFREDMLKGTVLISPNDAHDFFAFFVKSQINDSRPHQEESVADQRLALICGNTPEDFQVTSPAKLLDLHTPQSFSQPATPPAAVSNEAVMGWAFEKITMPQFDQTQQQVADDTQSRRAYLEEAFSSIIMDIQEEINNLQDKLLLGDERVNEKVEQKYARIDELRQKKQARLAKLDLMQELSMKTPEVLGCAYVVPLNQLQYQRHFGMSRDDEAEAVAMQVATDYEISSDRTPEDVSADNLGYDIRSSGADHVKRYIEVKGRSADGGIMLSENEKYRLSQLGASAWLYIVTHCKSDPQLFRIQDPGNTLAFEELSKGVQFFLPERVWKAKTNA